MNNTWSQQNPNRMPERQTPKDPDRILYLCGGASCLASRSLPAHRASQGVEIMMASDCGAKNEVSQTEPIRCKECGFRVLYKPRTHRSELRLFVPCDRQLTLQL